MDLKIFMTTFGAIFFAELADKTQLVGMNLTAKSGKPCTVFLGSVSAYIIVTALSVVLGSVLGSYLKPVFIRIGGGSVFILIGLLMLFDKI